MAAPVLIIGATGGIGEALARRLAGAGRPCFLIARDETRLGALASDLGADFAVADVLDEASLEQAVGKACASGALGGLAYCVGSIVLKPLRQLTAADMLEAYSLNVVGAALAVKHAAQSLKAGGGSVVMFSTIAARQGFANHAVIASAKAGVEGLTLSLAAELAPEVRVNCIAPSLTQTPLAAAMTKNPALAEAIAKMHAVPRLGVAEDHAALAAFLLSPEAGWITGQIIGVDGGRSTLRPKG